MENYSQQPRLIPSQVHLTPKGEEHITQKAKKLYEKEQAARKEEEKAYNESERSNVDKDLEHFILPGVENWGGYTKARCDEKVLQTRG